MSLRSASNSAGPVHFNFGTDVAAAAAATTTTTTTRTGQSATSPFGINSIPNNANGSGGGVVPVSGPNFPSDVPPSSWLNSCIDGSTSPVSDTANKTITLQGTHTAKHLRHQNREHDSFCSNLDTQEQVEKYEAYANEVPYLSVDGRRKRRRMTMEDAFQNLSLHKTENSIDPMIQNQQQQSQTPSVEDLGNNMITPSPISTEYLDGRSSSLFGTPSNSSRKTLQFTTTVSSTDPSSFTIRSNLSSLSDGLDCDDDDEDEDDDDDNYSDMRNQHIMEKGGLGDGEEAEVDERDLRPSFSSTSSTTLAGNRDHSWKTPNTKSKNRIFSSISSTSYNYRNDNSDCNNMMSTIPTSVTTPTRTVPLETTTSSPTCHSNNNLTHTSTFAPRKSKDAKHNSINISNQESISKQQHNNKHQISEQAVLNTKTPMKTECINPVDARIEELIRHSRIRAFVESSSASKEKKHQHYGASGDDYNDMDTTGTKEMGRHNHYDYGSAKEFWFRVKKQQDEEKQSDSGGEGSRQSDQSNESDGMEDDIDLRRKNGSGDKQIDYLNSQKENKVAVTRDDFDVVLSNRDSNTSGWKCGKQVLSLQNCTSSNTNKSLDTHNVPGEKNCLSPLQNMRRTPCNSPTRKVISSVNINRTNQRGLKIPTIERGRSRQSRNDHAVTYSNERRSKSLPRHQKYIMSDRIKNENSDIEMKM